MCGLQGWAALSLGSGTLQPIYKCRASSECQAQCCVLWGQRCFQHKGYNLWMIPCVTVWRCFSGPRRDEHEWGVGSRGGMSWASEDHRFGSERGEERRREGRHPS